MVSHTNSCDTGDNETAYILSCLLPCPSAAMVYTFHYLPVALPDKYWQYSPHWVHIPYHTYSILNSNTTKQRQIFSKTHYVISYWAYFYFRANPVFFSLFSQYFQQGFTVFTSHQINGIYTRQDNGHCSHVCDSLVVLISENNLIYKLSSSKIFCFCPRRVGNGIQLIIKSNSSLWQKWMCTDCMHGSCNLDNHILKIFPHPEEMPPKA